MHPTTDPTSDEAALYKRMFARERAARIEAERLLEQKSLALYDTNLELIDALAMQRREAFYQTTILETVKDGILTIAADGIIQTANPGACHLFGYDHADLLGMVVEDLLSLDATKTRPTADNHFLADLCTTQHPVLEAIGKSAEGNKLTLELSASYGQIEDEALITWVVRDVGFIDAIKRQSNLSQRLEGIGELAAGIAHEINTPIQFVIENTKFIGEAYAAVHRGLDIYQSQLADDPTIRQALQTACPADELAFYLDEVPAAVEETKAGAARIGEIVTAIKEFSHPGTEAMTSISLNDLVSTAVTVTNNNCKYVATVHCELDGSQPTVSCLRGQITQVMVNLIVNAADAIAEKQQRHGSGQGTITVRTGGDDCEVFFSVADTGMGIEPEHLERIFLPFFTTKDVGKGTGQGLAITHSIVVENHRGRIDIQSLPGVGTEFIVRLPRMPEQTNEAIE